MVAMTMGPSALFAYSNDFHTAGWISISLPQSLLGPGGGEGRGYLKFK